MPLVVNFLKVCTEFVDDPLYKILEDFVYNINELRLLCKSVV